jgi:plastocyanin
MRPHALLAALAAAVVLAAGCGSGSDSTGTTASSAPASKPASSGGAVAVKMQNIQFAPKDVTVKAGQTITWTNDDTVDHNVTATAGAAFKSKDFGKGGSFSFKAAKAGTIKYVCTIHPGMSGTVTVQ